MKRAETPCDGVRRPARTPTDSTDSPPKTKQTTELLRQQDTEEKQETGVGVEKEGHRVQPNPGAAHNGALKYTERTLSVRTNGRSGSSKNNGEGKYTWSV